MIKKENAIVLTIGLLNTSNGKTAHGLIRGSERFNIVGIIDEVNKGKDAGEVLDGKHRNIPIYASIDEAMQSGVLIKYCIVGIALHGGKMAVELLIQIEIAIRHKLSIVNGLHDLLSNFPDIVQLAKDFNVELIDIRKPKHRSEMNFWEGKIYDVHATIIAVLGMDCNMGKRTTCRMVRQACEKQNINAQMIYTGQTGWMQGGEYGFIFDTTLNDFISGEIETAIVKCYNETKADVILIEGQASLRNPSGPCGSEFLISGNAKHIILVHAPKRKYFDGDELWGEIPSAKSEIELIEMYGSTVIALALNTENCTTEEALAFQKQYEAELNIPVLLPIQQGVDKVVPVIESILKKTRN